MTPTDHDTLLRIQQAIGTAPAPAGGLTADTTSTRRPRHSGGPIRWWWIAGAFGVVAALLLGMIVGRLGDGAQDALPTTTATLAPEDDPRLSEVIVAGNLLGGVAGAEEVGAAEPIAYPGQPLTAPEPRDGTALDYQWVTCTDPIDIAKCEAVNGATDSTWTSPPISAATYARVVMIIDLGGGSQVRAASESFRAMPFPPGYTPGQGPLPSTSTLPATSTTAAPTRNPYGDTIGKVITDPSNPAAAYALAVAGTGTVPAELAAAGSPPALYAQWAATARGSAAGGDVVATTAGYRVVVDVPVELREFEIDANGRVTGLVECSNDGERCNALTSLVLAQPACTAEGPGCPTLRSNSGGVQAVLLATINLRYPKPSLLYQLTNQRPIASITEPSGAVTFSSTTPAFMVVTLAGPPQPGSRQTFTITYSDQGQPATDPMDIGY